jgi:hypothetical protein
MRVLQTVAGLFKWHSGYIITKIPKAFRQNQSTRGHIDQIPAWDQVDCLKKRRSIEHVEFKTKRSSPHYEYLAAYTVERNGRHLFRQPHGTRTQLRTLCG